LPITRKGRRRKGTESPSPAEGRGGGIKARGEGDVLLQASESTGPRKRVLGEERRNLPPARVNLQARARRRG